MEAEDRHTQQRAAARAKIEPHYDRTWLMGKTLSTVFRNLVEGAVLVSIVLYLFPVQSAGYGGGRHHPAGFAIHLPGTQDHGVPANLLSLGAMDFGIIVDGAVIVIENILARLSQQPETLSHEERKQVIADAANEVGRPTCSRCSSSSRRTYHLACNGTRDASFSRWRCR